MLFDELGAPWEVHGCWEEHRQERDQFVNGLRKELENVGYDGSFYKVKAWPQRRPRNRDESVEVTGYVAYNTARREGVSPTYFHRQLEGFFKVSVCDSDIRLWPFLIRGPAARALSDYQLVRVRGRWIKRASDWLLFATDIRDNSTPAQLAQPLETFEMNGRCAKCGRLLAPAERWDFGADWKTRCEACQRSRHQMGLLLFSYGEVVGSCLIASSIELNLSRRR